MSKYNFDAEEYLARFIGKGLLAVGLAAGTILHVGEYVPSPFTSHKHTMPAVESMPVGTWLAYDAELHMEAKRMGYTVMLDFTADWCKYCKRNEKYIKSEEFLKAMGEQRVVLFVLDMTSFNREISDIAGQYRAKGLPTYVVEHSDGRESRWVGGISSMAKTMKALGLDWYGKKRRATKECDTSLACQAV